MSPGKTLASAGELTGADVPSLMTVGRDGAVFFWVYEPLPHSTTASAHPKRFGNIPGKRRKRKAPDADPEAAEEATDGANVSHAEASTPAGDDEQSSSAESDSSDAGTAAESSSSEDEEQQMPEGSDGAAGRQMEASTSGRGADDQHQSTSYAGTLKQALQHVHERLLMPCYL